MTEVPPAAALVRDFANTIDVEEGTDLFGDQAGVAGWLGDRELLTGIEVSAGQRERALVLRAGLRERLLLNNAGEGDAEVIARAEAMLGEVLLRVSLGRDPEPAAPLVPVAYNDFDVALGRIAAAWAHTVFSGDWRRLKQCPDHSCGWVFWDATRSRTRRWCTMRVCGNRAKTRAYAERRRSAG